MPSEDYGIQMLNRPGLHLPTTDLQALQASLRDLGARCLNPVPNYQVFSTDLSSAFDDKVLAIARQGDEVVAFAAAVVLPITGRADPVVHSGLTVVHPDHRRSSGLTQLLFGNIFLAVLGEFPRGVWFTTLAEVISSLVHISKYAVDVFPSPRWEAEHGRLDRPRGTHVAIAREISRVHRGAMAISPAAEFDEATFVFRGSNDFAEGRPFMKDVDDPAYWHRDRETSRFYRRLFRKNKGDEVLLVGFLDPDHVRRVAMGPVFKDDWGDKFSKL
ncbi:hypothetical protein JX265_008219 [Neoarthrinium moseri]|uniref:Uncharacterized protein n=1 Tax=Neoarthrinium moseri TaxID=1658444 RepID=A0A9Q0AKB6_9PEZI|nr:uncharacterized protein JN550_004917 [Neoarthrinium moseri]KAI1865172.1 hypothetical protein JX265_008219 [Neoarthrinium moseri]KAI1870771.1 hypothetical protein JN550_004917 [Neoarthrinium moseri]